MFTGGVADQRTRDVPVLLVSACGDPETMAEAARSGGAQPVWLNAANEVAVQVNRIGTALCLPVPCEVFRVNDSRCEIVNRGARHRNPAVTLIVVIRDSDMHGAGQKQDGGDEGGQLRSH